MKTVLDKTFERKGYGAPSAEEIARDEVARVHFLKYCDSNKCIRGRAHALKCNWHDNGYCVDCAFNPYNMIQRDERRGGIKNVRNHKYHAR